MENYKISFGKYIGKSIHVLVEDKSYCRWILNYVKNRETLTDYIINYKSYCKEIENNKIIKLNEIKNKMNGFDFFKLPTDILRKIFFMSKHAQYNDIIIKINLKHEKRLHDRLYNSNYCLCCSGECKSGFRYCYTCNKEMNPKIRKKLTDKRIKRTTESNDVSRRRNIDQQNKKWWFTEVIPKLKKIKSECNKPLCVVKSNSGELKVGYMSYVESEIGIHYY